MQPLFHGDSVTNVAASDACSKEAIDAVLVSWQASKNASRIALTEWSVSELHAIVSLGSAREQM